MLFGLPFLITPRPIHSRISYLLPITILLTLIISTASQAPEVRVFLALQEHAIPPAALNPPSETYTTAKKAFVMLSRPPEAQFSKC